MQWILCIFCFICHMFSLNWSFFCTLFGRGWFFFQLTFHLFSFQFGVLSLSISFQLWNCLWEFFVAWFDPQSVLDLWVWWWGFTFVVSVDTLSNYTAVCEKRIWYAYFGKSVLKLIFCFILTFGGFIWWLFGWTGGNSCSFESLLIHFLLISFKIINKNQ